MGSHDIKTSSGGAEHRAFMAALLRDLDALDEMIATGMIEADQQRIGAEQEMILVDQEFRPAPKALDILEHLHRAGMGEDITNELARFDIEANIPPVPVGPGMFEQLESQVGQAVQTVEEAAKHFACTPVLTGILPTLELRDLGKLNITPKERYYELDRVIRQMRGRDYELFIKGTDELSIRFPSIMLEALNTSFQIHFQVSADNFVPLYNIAQAVAGPVLAACVNSPLLLGRRLWQETRIAIFQQAVDTRRVGGAHREVMGRVRFGDAWVRESATEIFRNDIARFRPIFGQPEIEDSLALLHNGSVPKLGALALHNGTVYRWNRPCYGLTNGKPHLRLENRYLPSGPTVSDEVANAALWIGLMLGGEDAFGDVAAQMPFDHASTNFLRAARQGLDTHMHWLDGKSHSVVSLLLETILPAAQQGLEKVNLSSAEIKKYLGIIQQRVESGQTGAAWQIDSFAALHDSMRRGRSLVCLTAAIKANEQTGPVHQWPSVDPHDCGREPVAYRRVGQVMTTNLYTVAEDELVELVARIMDWEHLGHVLVEDHEHRLIGIISRRRLLRFLAAGAHKMAHDTQAAPPGQAAASEVMKAQPITVSPDTPTLDAIGIMRTHRISALPVVEGEQLVGIVTEHDFLRIAANMLEDRLRECND